jgi:hypothetical protein
LSCRRDACAALWLKCWRKIVERLCRTSVCVCVMSRCILAARSEKFRAMFARGFMEAGQEEVQLPQWSEGAFKAFLRWVSCCVPSGHKAGVY